MGIVRREYYDSSKKFNKNTHFHLKTRPNRKIILVYYSFLLQRKEYNKNIGFKSVFLITTFFGQCTNCKTILNLNTEGHEKKEEKKTSFAHQGYALSSNDDVSRINGTANNGTTIKKKTYFAASQYAREIKPKYLYFFTAFPIDKLIYFDTRQNLLELSNICLKWLYLPQNIHLFLVYLRYFPMVLQNLRRKMRTCF